MTLEFSPYFARSEAQYALNSTLLRRTETAKGQTISYFPGGALILVMS